MTTNCEPPDSSDGARERGESLPRVLIASDVRLHREGLAAILMGSRRLAIAGTVAGSDLTLACLSRLHPDIVLLDMALPDCLGVPAALDVGSAVKFVAFAVSEVHEDILACAEAGISGFIGKDSSAEDVVMAIEGVMRGEVLCPPRLAARLLQRLAALAKSQARRQDVTGLTGRELEIMDLIDQGCSNKEIAQRLCIGPATVKNHVHNILEKLHVHRRAEAAAAIRNITGSRYGSKEHRETKLS